MSNFSNVSDSLKSVSQMYCISSKDSELSDILSSRSSSTNQQSMICKAFSQSRRVPVEAEASTPATTAALRDNLPWTLEREKVIFCFVSTETSDIHISVILTSQATPKCWELGFWILSSWKDADNVLVRWCFCLRTLKMIQFGNSINWCIFEPQSRRNIHFLTLR